MTTIGRAAVDGESGESLRRRAASGVVWSAAQRWAVRIGGLITVAVLARVLTPDQFGLVAVAMAFVPILYLLSDAGFSTYVVQADDEDPRMLSTAFWYSVGCGVLLAGGLSAIAPVVAQTLQLPALTPVILGLAPTVLLVAVSAVPIALLRRRLAFRVLAIQSFVAAVVGQVAAIALALLGYGVWALVVQLLLNQAVGAILAWTYSRFRPQWAFSAALFRSMLRFGVNVIGVEFVAMIRLWAETAIITAVLGVTRLGHLNIAQRLVQATQDLSGAALLPVSTAVFAQIRNSPARLAAAYRDALSMLYLVVFPVLAGAAIGAPLLVPILFGDQWTASIVPAQALTLAGILTMGAMLDHGLFYGMGRPGRWLIYALAVDGLTVLSTALLAPLGLAAVAWGFVGVATVATVARWFLVARLLGTNVWSSAAPFLAASVAVLPGAAAATGILFATASWPAVVSLLAMAAGMVLPHLVVVRIFFPRTFTEIMHLVLRRVPGRPRRRRAPRQGTDRNEGMVR